MPEAFRDVEVEAHGSALVHADDVFWEVKDWEFDLGDLSTSIRILGDYS